MAKKKEIIEEKKIPQRGKKFIYGKAYLESGTGKVDPRQSEEEKLDTIIHELLHIIFDVKTESGVAVINYDIPKFSKIISDELWIKGYRKVKL